MDDKEFFEKCQEAVNSRNPKVAAALDYIETVMQNSDNYQTPEKLIEAINTIYDILSRK